jgi:hypothetical protein
MTDGEKKEFIKSFVEEVHLYEKEQEDGRFLKRIKFNFLYSSMEKRLRNLIGTMKVPLKRFVC